MVEAVVMAATEPLVTPEVAVPVAAAVQERWACST